MTPDEIRALVAQLLDEQQTDQLIAEKAKI
jgi:hypothetical protein